MKNLRVLLIFATRSSRVTVASVGVTADDLARCDGSKRSPGHPVYRVLDEPDAAVAEQGVDAAGVVLSFEALPKQFPATGVCTFPSDATTVWLRPSVIAARVRLTFTMKALRESGAPGLPMPP